MELDSRQCFWAGVKQSPESHSICLCGTNTALNHNGPNPIYLVQYQFNSGFILPVPPFIPPFVLNYLR